MDKIVASLSKGLVPVGIMTGQGRPNAGYPSTKGNKCR